MPGKFKPGDLVILNQYGIFITYTYNHAIGIIISDAYNLLSPIEAILESFYTVYDVLLDGRLFRLVPEDFMEFYEKYEKDDK